MPQREQFNIISNAPIGDESAPVGPTGGKTTRPVNPIQVDAPALPYRRVSQQIGQVPPSNPTIEAMKRGDLSLLYPIENHSVHQPWSPTAESSAAPRKLTSSQCRALRAQVPTGDEWGQITALQVMLAEEDIQKQVEEKKRARLQTKEEVLAQIEANKRKQAELLIQKKGIGADTEAMRELERKWTEEASKLQEEIAFKNMTYKQQLDYDARKKREAVERVKKMEQDKIARDQQYQMELIERDRERELAKKLKFQSEIDELKASTEHALAVKAEQKRREREADVKVMEEMVHSTLRCLSVCSCSCWPWSLIYISLTPLPFISCRPCL